jgi:hypothetical protein
LLAGALLEGKTSCTLALIASIEEAMTSRVDIFPESLYHRGVWRGIFIWPHRL